jgi:Protein of unknown function (DUF1559)
MNISHCTSSVGQLNRQRRSGLSRTDVVVVVSVLLCLGLLAVPIIGSVRESSRRTLCVNNLRTLGLAIHAYEAASTLLPPAAVWTTEGLDPARITPGPIDPLYPNILSIDPGTYSDTTHENWAILLLPYLHASEVVDRFDSSVPINSGTNQTVRETTLAHMSCPSDQFNRSDNYYVRELPNGNGAYARGSYAINGGTHSYCFSPGLPSEPCPDGMYYELDRDNMRFKWWGSGVAGINKSFAIKDITTIRGRMVVFDEIRAGIDPVDSRGVWALGQIGGSITWNHGQYGDVNTPNDRYERADDIVGCGKLHKRFSKDQLSAMGMPCCSYIEANKQAGARSMHVSGVHVLFLDGNAAFIGDGIDASLWHAIHSRDVPKEVDLSL